MTANDRSATSAAAAGPLRGKLSVLGEKAWPASGTHRTEALRVTQQVQPGAGPHLCLPQEQATSMAFLPILWMM